MKKYLEKILKNFKDLIKKLIDTPIKGKHRHICLGLSHLSIKRPIYMSLSLLNAKLKWVLESGFAT